MRKVKEELLDHLCELARLELTEAERASFAAKFAQVLDFVGRIQALNLDAKEVPPFVMKERQEPAGDTVEGCELAADFPRDYRVGVIGDLEEAEGD